MKVQVFKAVAAAGLLVSSTLAFAEAPTLGEPSYQGNGCPDGSVAATLSPDNKALSVLFSNFVAEAGGTTGLGTDRKSCKMRIPVQVPAGISIAITQAEYRGFQALPDRGYEQYTTQFSLQGTPSPRFNRRFVGPINKDFYALNRLKVTDVKWSSCSRVPAVVPVDIDVSIIVASNGKLEQATAALDSQEINSSIDFGVQFKNCP